MPNKKIKKLTIKGEVYDIEGISPEQSAQIETNKNSIASLQTDVKSNKIYKFDKSKFTGHSLTDLCSSQYFPSDWPTPFYIYGTYEELPADVQRDWDIFRFNQNDNSEALQLDDSFFIYIGKSTAHALAFDNKQNMFYTWNIDSNGIITNWKRVDNDPTYDFIPFPTLAVHIINNENEDNYGIDMWIPDEFHNRSKLIQLFNRKYNVNFALFHFNSDRGWIVNPPRPYGPSGTLMTTKWQVLAMPDNVPAPDGSDHNPIYAHDSQQHIILDDNYFRLLTNFNEQLISYTQPWDQISIVGGGSPERKLMNKFHLTTLDELEWINGITQNYFDFKLGLIINNKKDDKFIWMDSSTYRFKVKDSIMQKAPNKMQYTSNEAFEIIRLNK